MGTSTVFSSLEIDSVLSVDITVVSRSCVETTVVGRSFVVGTSTVVGSVDMTVLSWVEMMVIDRSCVVVAIKVYVTV